MGFCCDIFSLLTLVKKSCYFFKVKYNLLVETQCRTSVRRNTYTKDVKSQGNEYVSCEDLHAKVCAAKGMSRLWVSGSSMPEFACWLSVPNQQCDLRLKYFICDCFLIGKLTTD